MLNHFSFAERTRCFELLKTFPTRGGMAVTSFEIQNKLFIAFANYGDNSVGYKAKLPVYLLQNNNFTLNQTLDTSGALDVEYFAISGEHFLVVANEFDGKSIKQGSVLYRWEAGTFKEIQHIPNNDVVYTHCFTIDTRTFMSVTNSDSNQVSIYKWKNEKFGNKTQDIAIKEPLRCSTFTISNSTYIACGSLVDFNATTVLKWSGNRFQPFQVPPSSYVEGRLHTFKANGILYLAIPNFEPPMFSGKTDTDSYIYRWDGTKFVHHQSIPTYGAADWDSFTTSDGQVFLVVANFASYKQSGLTFDVKSAVYKMAESKFSLYQKLPSSGAVYVHAFTHKGTQYLAVVNNNYGSGFNFDSALYIWK